MKILLRSTVARGNHVKLQHQEYMDWCMTNNNIYDLTDYNVGLAHAHPNTSLIPRILVGRDKIEPGNLHTTKLTEISFTCWKVKLRSHTACETLLSSFDSQKKYRFDSNCSITSFKTIGKLERERLHQSCAVGFSWNGQTHGWFL